ELIIDEARGQQLASFIVDDLLAERLPQALRERAVNLPRDDERVDERAEVVDGRVAVDRHLTGVRIDLDLANVTSVRERGRLGGKERARLQPGAKLLGNSGGMIGSLRDVGDGDHAVSAADAKDAVEELEVLHVRLEQESGDALRFLDERVGGQSQRAAPDDGAAGRISAAPERDLVGVTLQEADLLDRNTKPIRDALAVRRC